MASKVEICNMALQNIGANAITSLTENSTNSVECNLRFDSARRAVLAVHPWNFAIKRAALSASTTAPAFTYQFGYTLPADYLMMIMTAQQEQSQGAFFSLPNPSKVTENNLVAADKYVIENGQLLSNVQGVKIIYVFDQEDTTQFSAPFVDLLSYFLASRITYKIKGDTALSDRMMAVFEDKLKEFKTLDSQQGVPNRIRRSRWLASRYVGYN